MNGNDRPEFYCDWDNIKYVSLPRIGIFFLSYSPDQCRVHQLSTLVRRFVPGPEAAVPGRSGSPSGAIASVGSAEPGRSAAADGMCSTRDTFAAVAAWSTFHPALFRLGRGDSKRSWW